MVSVSYQPTAVPKSDLSFVWPITLAAFASGNGAKSMERHIDFQKPKEMRRRDGGEAVVEK